MNLLFLISYVFEQFNRRCIEVLGTVSLLYHVALSTPRMNGLPPDYSGALEWLNAF
jgi:hypothetical protein